MVKKPKCLGGLFFKASFAENFFPPKQKKIGGLQFFGVTEH